MIPPDSGKHLFWSRFRHRKLAREAARFSAVGALNFVLTFVIYYVLIRIVHANYLLALTASWSIGILFSYVLNFAWVFKPEQGLNFQWRFARYSIASAVSLCLNLVALGLIVEGGGYDPFYVQCALIPAIVLFNFSTAKFWSLKVISNSRDKEIR